MYWVHHPTGDSQLILNGRRIAAIYRVRSAIGVPTRWEAVIWEADGTRTFWGDVFDARADAEAEVDRMLTSSELSRKGV